MKAGKGVLALALVLVVAAGAAVFFVTGRPDPLTPGAICAAYEKSATRGDAKFSYPLNDTLFPPESIAPIFRWSTSNLQADAWVIRVQCRTSGPAVTQLVRAREWTPPEQAWEAIKQASLDAPAVVTLIGVDSREPEKILAADSIRIRTSRDEVGAPIFYREVNLPFIDAARDPSRIRWRFGAISSKTQPPIVLENMPVCGNCHSFSADGHSMGMDVDYGNDKGSYAILPLASQMYLAKSTLITWSDYKRDKTTPTFGLLSQLSPDGAYAVSTVKDRSVFVPRMDFAFSQLFFPIKGILAIYDRKTKTFEALPGADDPAYVQSNAAWSPDGKYIVFARAPAFEKKLTDENSVLLSLEDCREFLDGERLFKFELYRVPFNGGKGGKAEPLPGASGNGMSNYFPKYSPDGKWIVFCKAKSFMLLQPDSELYIIPAGGGEARRMECNTPRMNSWHSWSPNGKWLVFSSKANGPFTQLFLTHIDENGHSAPPVLLEQFTSPDRAANIPEFVNAPAGAIANIKPGFFDDSSYYRAAVNAMYAKDDGQALSGCLQALELNPNNCEAHELLGRIFVTRGDFENAVKQLRASLQLKPDAPEVWFCLGELYLQHGKAKEAEDTFAELRRHAPGAAEWPQRIGVCYLAHQHILEAERYALETLALKSDSAGGHCLLGIVRLNQHSYREAREQLEESQRLDPKFPEAQISLGLLCAQENKNLEAVEHFKIADQLKPGTLLVLQYLEQSYAVTGQAELAAQTAERELALLRVAPNPKAEQEAMARLRRYKLGGR